jgi:hypothetical protein
MRMCDHTVVAKAVVTTACSLAIAFSTIGMGVNSSWAGSDQASGLNYTPISLELTTQAAPHLPRADRRSTPGGRIQWADDCVWRGRDPGGGNCYKCCSKSCQTGTNNVCN